MEATKVKKKLHGSILKGSKVKVEEARAEAKDERNAEEEKKLEAEAEKKAKKIGKKRKREEGVVPGVELPTVRKVKRGWTEPAGSLKNVKVKATAKGSKHKESKKAKAQMSLFSDGSECLFRTKLPQNAVEMSKQFASRAKDVGKKKQSTSTREVLVHEFSNTTKYASFLRDDQVPHDVGTSAEFVEGKGWINENGNIIERLPMEQELKAKTTSIATETRDSRIKKPSKDQEYSNGIGHKDEMVTNDLDQTSSSGTSSSSDDESIASKSNDRTISSIVSNDIEGNGAGDESDATSTNGSSSSSVHAKVDTTPPRQTVTSTELQSNDVHPLEALFKKPKLVLSGSPRKPALEVKTSFSFFEPDEKNDESTDRLIPQTPFTQRDLQYRSMRSAAPTPDTAAPTKTSFGNLWARDDEAESEDDRSKDLEAIGEQEEASSSTPKASTDMSMKVSGEKEPTESDFSKWFWEHRGETNRAWKKRRREAAKEKRQKDNKRKGRNAV